MEENYEEPVYYLPDNVYHGSHPYFYDTNEFPWVKELEANWAVIRDEVLEQMEKHDAVKSVNSYNLPIIVNPQNWANLYFENFMWMFNKNRKQFPKTVKILESIPGEVMGTISIMRGRSAFLPHHGQTNTNIRCHLGLVVPGSLPECGIRVGDQTQPWREGKVLMFSDSQKHETWNHTDGDRILFIFDILRKEYEPRRYWVCVRYLAAQSVKYFDQDYELLKAFPTLFYFLHAIFTVIWALYLPINRRFHFK